MGSEAALLPETCFGGIDLATEEKTAANPVIEINVMRLIKIFIRKWWLFVLFSFLLAGAGYAWATMNYVPAYTASASFVVDPRVTATDNTTSKVTNTDLTAAEKLATTYQYVLKGKDMLIEVKDELKLDSSIEQLQKNVKISTEPESFILRLSVTWGNPDTAYQICNSLVTSKIPEMLEEINYPSIRVYDSPTRPNHPNTYNRKNAWAGVGFLLGLILAALLIAVLEMSRDTAKKFSDLQRKCDVNVLGSVPAVIKTKSGNKNKKRGLLVTDFNAGFSFVENIKSIRTKVETFSEKHQYKRLLVTSSLENEGKSTMAVNLAITLTQNGKSVLLIDADLRKPSVHKLLEFRSNKEEGLTAILEGSATWQDSIRYIAENGIVVLPSGKIPNNSSELLASEKMGDLLDELEQEFDYIVIDTAPTCIVTDATILTNYTDAVIFVVKQDFARFSEINQALSDLSEQRAKVIGCIFNIADEQGGPYGYGRKYYRSYYRSSER